MLNRGLWPQTSHGGKTVRLFLIILPIVVFGLTMAPPINAANGPISRLQFDSNSYDAEGRALLDGYRSRGQPINLNLVSALSPKLARARAEVTRVIRYDSAVPRPLRELTILRTAQLMGGDYEIHQHNVAALSCGFSQEKLDALSDWEASKLFSEKERALLGYLDQAIRRKSEVEDKTFAELARLFSPKEIVEITLISAQYMGTSMFTKALQVKIDEPGVLSAIVLGPC
jgi:alkylhydroperoxidase family enzyme